MDVIVKQQEKPLKENINPNLLKDKPRVQVEYKTPKVELSEGIQAFDKKPRVFTQNPYDYNSVSLKKDTNFTPSAEQMIVDPVYNLAGKALGVDTIHDWNRYYDKVKSLVDWAKKETGYSDGEKIASWIYSQIRQAPSMGARKIDDLFIYSRLKTETKKAPVKTIIKKVYVKQKMTQDDMVKRLIYG